MIAFSDSCEKSRCSPLLRGESLAAFAAPACNHFCTGMRFHPVAETAYLAPLSTVGLKSLFHLVLFLLLSNSQPASAGTLSIINSYNIILYLHTAVNK